LFGLVPVYGWFHHGYAVYGCVAGYRCGLRLLVRYVVGSVTVWFVCLVGPCSGSLVRHTLPAHVYVYVDVYVCGLRSVRLGCSVCRWTTPRLVGRLRLIVLAFVGRGLPGCYVVLPFVELVVTRWLLRCRSVWFVLGCLVALVHPDYVWLVVTGLHYYVYVRLFTVLRYLLVRFHWFVPWLVVRFRCWFDVVGCSLRLWLRLVISLFAVPFLWLFVGYLFLRFTVWLPFPYVSFAVRLFTFTFCATRFTLLRFLGWFVPVRYVQLPVTFDCGSFPTRVGYVSFCCWFVVWFVTFRC